MKTTLVCTLLVCCLCLGAHAEDKKPNDGLSSIKARKLQLGTQGLQTPKRKLTDETENQCIPAIVPLYEFKRKGELKTFICPSDLNECIYHCSVSDPECVAINFDAKAENCTILTSATEIVLAYGWSTALIRFENNDPCHDGNIVRDFHQANSDYKIFPPGEVLTPNACCEKCVADQPVGCVAWDYQSESQKCYLKKTSPPFKPATRPGLLYTGFACLAPEVPPRVVV